MWLDSVQEKNSTMCAGVVRVGLPIVRDPGDYLHEVSDEAGDETFENPCVAAKDEFVYHSALVELLDNCRRR